MNGATPNKRKRPDDDRRSSHRVGSPAWTNTISQNPAGNAVLNGNPHQPMNHVPEGGSVSHPGTGPTQIFNFGYHLGSQAG